MISTTNIEEQPVEVNSPLPDIPENSSKEVIRDILNDYAFKNNFVVVIQKSEEKKDWSLSVKRDLDVKIGEI
ncbi:hypothetical protein G6F56_001095 [Rhizopus delemar]|nr:hypothetical protein G6F56_001095 [Rhizopus delemar]